ncbi:MAG: CDP-glycerol glycerophosphotransferase family protein, partial [Stackebrandtia sp.]
HAAIEAVAPRFLVHFSAPAGSEYQLLMWLPYFDRLGDPYVIILRDRAFLPAISAATKTPVVVAGGISDVESLLADSIRAVFYVNQSMQNTQCVRFARLTHVQLMHGDSDKPASYNPISAMYDRIFVAGQAGVDRYHNHGVDIPDSRFRVVGHPQAARVEVREGPRDASRPPTALYAPTWTGLSSDVNFCSLPLAVDICEAMLERGATMVVRPHPYTRTNPAAARQLDAVERLLGEDRERTGRAHLFGKTTSQKMSLIDCVNAADVMVCDVSGAASDWLYSEKPFAIVDVVGAGDALAEELPLARAAYVVRADGANIGDVCDELLTTDPLAAARHKMKTYYMGDFPAQEYEAAFLNAARDCYRT